MSFGNSILPAPTLTEDEEKTVREDIKDISPLNTSSIAGKRTSLDRLGETNLTTSNLDGYLLPNKLKNRITSFINRNAKAKYYYVR